MQWQHANILWRLRDDRDSAQRDDPDKQDHGQTRVFETRESFKEIVGNIAEIGLKRPITVTRRAEAGGPFYDLVCGQGRLKRMRPSGQKEVPALVVSANQEDCLVASLVENCARRQHRRRPPSGHWRNEEPRSFGPGDSAQDRPDCGARLRGRTAVGERRAAPPSPSSRVRPHTIHRCAGNRRGGRCWHPGGTRTPMKPIFFRGRKLCGSGSSRRVDIWAGLKVHENPGEPRSRRRASPSISLKMLIASGSLSVEQRRPRAGCWCSLPRLWPTAAGRMQRLSASLLKRVSLICPRRLLPE